MIGKRPTILTISGLDPSNGAGLTADLQTINKLKGYAVSVCSANTVQTDEVFQACHWTDFAVMQAQIELLFARFSFDVVKIGIVENWEVLGKLVDVLLQLQPKLKIIVDPVLKASAGFAFHGSDTAALEAILGKLYLITPNTEELTLIAEGGNTEEVLARLVKNTNVLLTGGHSNIKGQDVLYAKSGGRYTINPKIKACTEKHGSGCILSSAIAAYTASGYPLLKACLRGKRYTERMLSSNNSLLAFHG